MSQDLDALKDSILRQVVEKAKEFPVDFSRIDEASFRRRVEAMFKSVIRDNRGIALTQHQQDEILSDITAYLLGLGPIEKLLKDPNITEVMVNGPKQVYIEKEGVIQLTDVTFRDEEHLAYFIEKIISPLGRRITEFEPYVDARLSDGSRVNIVRSPVSSIGPILTIRKFSHRVLTIEDLVKSQTMDDLTAEFLRACAVARLNILISGGASSGKTTLLNALGAFIPEGERVIIIEDTKELHFPRQHNIYMETRAPNIEGKGEITIRDLLRNSLHMRPDRIIVGEVRSDEVLDMIQAMNTGHDGSMTTLHANSPLEAMDRLEVLTLMGSANISSEVAKRQIVSAVDLIIHMSRFPDGLRKIAQVDQILKEKEYVLQDIFILEEDTGKLKPTGNLPIFYLKLKNKANYEWKGFGG